MTSLSPFPRLRPQRLQSSYELVDHSAARRLFTVFHALLVGDGAPLCRVGVRPVGSPSMAPSGCNPPPGGWWQASMKSQYVSCFRSERMRVQICLSRDDACALLFVQHDARALLNIHDPCALHFVARAVALQC